MSIRCLNRIWEHSQHKGSKLLMMLAIADFASDDGTGAYPSIETLAEKTRMSMRHVKRVIRELEESGELIINEGHGRGNTHEYTVNVWPNGEKGDNLSSNIEKKGDTATSPFKDEKGDNLSSFDEEKVTSDTEKVTSDTEKVTPMSPDPLDPTTTNAAAARARAREEPGTESEPRTRTEAEKLHEQTFGLGSITSTNEKGIKALHDQYPLSHIQEAYRIAGERFKNQHINDQLRYVIGILDKLRQTGLNNDTGTNTSKSKSGKRTRATAKRSARSTKQELSPEVAEQIAADSARKERELQESVGGL